MPHLLERLERFDWTLVTAAIVLAALGLVEIYGIGVSREPADLFPFYKQLVAALLGLTAIVVLISLDYRQMKAYSFLLYLGGGLLLTTVLFFGHTIRHTQGWFRLGSLSFQPVEIAKVTLTIYLAALFARRSHGRLSWREFGLSGCATFAYAALVFLQPDFGSGMVLVGIWVLLSLFARLPHRAWFFLPLAVLALSGLVWSVGLKPYQQERILTFLHPGSDPRGASYNAAQAHIAIGSGGWFGKGIGEGSQARLRFLPAAATDFMFAVIGEELGFIGISIVLGLFLLILYRFIRLAEESGEDFAALLLIGLGAGFLIHITVNGGMNLGIMPITGLPMPFLSAAASSLVVAFISIGLAESVAIKRRGKGE
ncbi:MAG: FtsW/RodA/SpoVE family cell cycle protein [Candidatus Uhrbacteria bacterium]|nr:FtsW/RodA/SpoVE family cell cycle protein [Candidatus Uhrbacteria bacterium]